MPDLTQRIPSWRDTPHQRVLNAAPIPERSRQRDLPEPVAVDARIVWEHDGAETIRTRAHGWAERLVYVELDDPRVQVRWVWLPVKDVRRVGVELSSTETPHDPGRRPS